LAEDAAATKLVRSCGRRVRLAGPSFDWRAPSLPMSSTGRPGGAAAPAHLSRLFPARDLDRKSAPGVAGALASALLDGPVMPTALAIVSFWLAAEAWLARAAGWPLSWRSPSAWLVRDVLILLIWVRAYTAGGYEWRGNRISIAGAGAIIPARPSRDNPCAPTARNRAH
jgi:ceramide glucosyltransferase